MGKIVTEDKVLYGFLFTAPNYINDPNKKTWQIYQERLYSILQSIIENGIENIEIINNDCRNITSKADVIHLGYIGNTIDFLEHTYNCLKENGIAIFHEAYRNNWLGFKSRSDWIGIPDNFSKLMKTKGFTVEKFERVKFYGPSTSHIIAILRKN